MVHGVNHPAGCDDYRPSTASVSQSAPQILSVHRVEAPEMQDMQDVSGDNDKESAADGCDTDSLLQFP